MRRFVVDRVRERFSNLYIAVLLQLNSVFYLVLFCLFVFPSPVLLLFSQLTYRNIAHHIAFFVSLLCYLFRDHEPFFIFLLSPVLFCPFSLPSCQVRPSLHLTVCRQHSHRIPTQSTVFLLSARQRAHRFRSPLLLAFSSFLVTLNRILAQQTSICTLSTSAPFSNYFILLHCLI